MTFPMKFPMKIALPGFRRLGTLCIVLKAKKNNYLFPVSTNNFLTGSVGNFFLFKKWHKVPNRSPTHLWCLPYVPMYKQITLLWGHSV